MHTYENPVPPAARDFLTRPLTARGVVSELQLETLETASSSSESTGRPYTPTAEEGAGITTSSSREDITIFAPGSVTYTANSPGMALPEGSICVCVDRDPGPGVNLALGTNPGGSSSFGNRIGTLLLVDKGGALPADGDGAAGLLPVGRGIGRFASAGLRKSPARGVGPEFAGVFPGVFDCGREGGWIVISGTELLVERLSRWSIARFWDDEVLGEISFEPEESDGSLGR